MKSKEFLLIAAVISFFALNAHAQTLAQLQGADHGLKAQVTALQTAIQNPTNATVAQTAGIWATIQ